MYGLLAVALSQRSLVQRGFPVSGAMARDFVPFCLIPPTAPETKALGKDNVVRARERTVERVLDRR